MANVCVRVCVRVCVCVRAHICVLVSLCLFALTISTNTRGLPLRLSEFFVCLCVHVVSACTHTSEPAAHDLEAFMAHVLQAHTHTQTPHWSRMQGPHLCLTA